MLQKSFLFSFQVNSCVSINKLTLLHNSDKISYIITGGCKHAIALLAWLHRRSEEPSVTEVTCYWKKSKLSTVGKSLKFIKAKDLGKKKVSNLCEKSGSFLSDVLQMSQETGSSTTTLTKYTEEFSEEDKLSIHQLMLNFFEQVSSTTALDFLQYCSSQMTEAACDEASRKTVLQDKNKLWHELRYGRITASRAYESAHCQTTDGSLVESILGAKSIKDTCAMKRGKKLENEVRHLVEKKVGIKIQPCGFYTSPECPVLGASPDGISDEYIIEIKCPSSEKTIKNYISVSDGKITHKYNAQVQMQMHFAKRQKALFCVANHNFESTKEIFIISVDYDANYFTELHEKCTNFWINAIYPVLQEYNK